MKSQVTNLSYLKIVGLVVTLLISISIGMITTPLSPSMWLGFSMIAAIVTFIILSRCMGLWATTIFALLTIAIAFLAEGSSIQFLESLNHFLQPQIWSVPIPILLGWFVALSSAYALSYCLSQDWGTMGRIVLTPAIATLYDLTVDPKGLAQGLWEWHQPGLYALQVQGVNGNFGIPGLNFIFWIIVAGIVTALFELLQISNPRSPEFDPIWALSGYLFLCLSGLVWMIQQQWWILIIIPLVPLLLIIRWTIQINQAPDLQQ